MHSSKRQSAQIKKSEKVRRKRDVRNNKEIAACMSDRDTFVIKVL